ncbi:MAG: MFS transporter [Micropruina sp.]|uniref:MFS transporter n=1 Tax=Micropruina sp. TaxID=2737536 RepID=UPI0039E37A35
MRAYREILTLPGAWQFSAAGLLARSGGAMMGIGLVLMVSALYGSYGLAGALAASNAVAWAVGTAALSNLVDRYGQRRVMYPATVVSASALALLVVFAMLQLPAWTLFPAAVVSGATGGAPGALVRARWNHVVTDPEQLHTAYSLESTLDEVTFMIGPVLATALSTGVHPAAGLIAPVLFALAGAQLLYSQRATEPPVLPRAAHADTPRLTHRVLLLVPGVAAVVAVNLLIGCVFGSIDVSVVAAATQWEVREASGVVLAVFSLASGAAGFYYGARRLTSPLARRFMVGVAAMCAACLSLLIAQSVPLLCLAGLLVGVTVAPTLINGNSLIARLVSPDRLTEGLSWMGTGIGIGVAIGSSASGQVIDHFGYHGGFATVAVFGLLALVIALSGFAALRRAVTRDHGGPRRAVVGRPTRLTQRAAAGPLLQRAAAGPAVGPRRAVDVQPTAPPRRAVGAQRASSPRK